MAEVNSGIDEQQTELVRSALPFTGLLGLEIVSSTKEEVHGRTQAVLGGG